MSFLEFVGLMPKETSTDEVVGEFRRKATRLVAMNDREGLKALFASSMAEAQSASRENQWAAKEAMRQALRDVLLEPSRRARTGWFER